MSERIRHATEKFVNNLINSMKKLIKSNTDQINVLSVDRGYSISKKVSGDIRELNTNGKFWCTSSDTINLPPQVGGERVYTVNVTTYLPNRLAIELTCIYDSINSSNHGIAFSSSHTSSGWTQWKEIATTDNSIQKVGDNKLSSKGIMLDTWGNCGAHGGGIAWYGSNLYKDSDGKYKYVNYHPNGTGGAFECDIFSRKPFYIRCTDTSAMNGGIANVEKLEIATTNKTDISLLNGWANVNPNYQLSASLVGSTLTLSGLVKNPSQPDHNVLIGKLPAGFRPSKINLYGSIFLKTGTGEVLNTWIEVHPDGSIVLANSKILHHWICLNGVINL